MKIRQLMGLAGIASLAGFIREEFRDPPSITGPPEDLSQGFLTPEKYFEGSNFPNNANANVAPETSELVRMVQPTPEELEAIRASRDYVEAQKILSGEAPPLNTGYEIERFSPSFVMLFEEPRRTSADVLRDEIVRLETDANFIDPFLSHGSVRQQEEEMSLMRRITAYRLALQDGVISGYDSMVSGIPVTSDDGPVTYKFQVGNDGKISEPPEREIDYF